MKSKDIKATAKRRKVDYQKIKHLIQMYGSYAVWIDYDNNDLLVTKDWYYQCDTCFKRWVVSGNAKQFIIENYWKTWHCERGKICKTTCPACQKAVINILNKL